MQNYPGCYIWLQNKSWPLSTSTLTSYINAMQMIFKCLYITNKYSNTAEHIYHSGLHSETGDAKSQKYQFLHDVAWKCKDLCRSAESINLQPGSWFCKCFHHFYLLLLGRQRHINKKIKSTRWMRHEQSDGLETRQPMFFGWDPTVLQTSITVFLLLFLTSAKVQLSSKWFRSFARQIR